MPEPRRFGRAKVVVICARMFENLNWALVIPMANEEHDFPPFIRELYKALEEIKSGKVYFVIDNAAKDRTLELCTKLSQQDTRFVTLWAPENRNVADAYLRGYKEALKNGHDYIFEMDAGLSHHPKQLPEFLRQALTYDCVLGSRFLKGGSMDSSPFRKFLSRGGTMLSNFLLGTNFSDMTSGYQGFKRDIVEKFTAYAFRSTAHFYQTELRFLIRKRNFVEIPIEYHTHTTTVKNSSIINSLQSLLYYTFHRHKKI